MCLEPKPWESPNSRQPAVLHSVLYWVVSFDGPVHTESLTGEFPSMQIIKCCFSHHTSVILMSDVGAADLEELSDFFHI